MFEPSATKCLFATQTDEYVDQPENPHFYCRLFYFTFGHTVNKWLTSIPGENVRVLLKYSFVKSMTTHAW